jgi:hypothetical protein
MHDQGSDFSVKNPASGRPVAAQRAVDIYDQMNGKCGTALEGMRCRNRF